MVKHFLTYWKISLLACLLLFCAFILFLLVALSSTIIKPIYLLRFRSTIETDFPSSLATELRFGVWGVCTVSSIPIDDMCFGPMLGYTVPDYVIRILDINPQVIQVVEKVLLSVLVLHPIVAGFSLFALFLSVFLFSHAMSICALIFATITALLSTAALGVDISLVLVARNELQDLSISDSLHFAIDFGNAVWMIVTAVALTWISVIVLSARACYCFGVRRYPKEHDHHHHNDKERKHEPEDHDHHDHNGKERKHEPEDHEHEHHHTHNEPIDRDVQSEKHHHLHEPIDRDVQSENDSFYTNR